MKVGDLVQVVNRSDRDQIWCVGIYVGPDPHPAFGSYHMFFTNEGMKWYDKEVNRFIVLQEFQ